MEAPLLYRQLMSQLRQWVKPKDQRHLGLKSGNCIGSIENTGLSRSFFSVLDLTP